MTKEDGRRRFDPESDRGITWALVVTLIAVMGVGGVWYGVKQSSLPNHPGAANASGSADLSSASR
jgi:hypothetical protein